MQRIIKESKPVDPFKGLRKIKVGEYEPTPPGAVTDGLGNVYEIPTTGYSKPVVIDRHTKIVYDFGHRQLCYVLNGQVVDRTHFSAENWFDNPEYAAQSYADRISDDAVSEVKYDDI